MASKFDKTIEIILLIAVALLICRASVLGANPSYCPTPIASYTVSYAANYGAWDGTYFWAVGYYHNDLYKFNSAGQCVTIYTEAAMAKPLSCDYDGTYLWIGGADKTGVLSKFNPVTETFVKHYNISIDDGNSGGIQDVVCDDTGFVWVACDGNKNLQKFNIATEAIDLTITTGGLNGIDYKKISGQGYIYTMSDYNKLWKINTTTGDYDIATFNAAGFGFRLALSDDAVYVATWNNSKVVKYNIDTLAYITSFDTTALPNTVVWDGHNIWTAGDSNNAVIHNPVFGNILCTFTGMGRSDLVFDGSNMWSIKAGTGETGAVYLISDIVQTATVTPSYTASPYITRTITPTVTPTVTKTVTATITQTNTNILTRTYTYTYTPYPTRTFTMTASPTVTISVTITPTNTPIVTKTITQTRTFSPTLTQSATITPSFTVSPTFTASPTNTTVTGEFLNQLSVRSDGTKSSVLLEWRQYPSDNKYYLTHGQFTEEITLDKDLAPLDKTRFIYELTVDGDASGLSVAIRAVGIDVYTGVATAVATVQAMPTPDLTPRHIFDINTVKYIKTPVINRRYSYAISAGEISGAVPFGKNGLNTSVGTSWETVWGGSNNYTFPATAQQMEVVSDNNTADFFLGGTGAKQVYIKYLKADYTEATEYINLSGTTAVQTVATDIYRINNFRVNSTGTGGANVGNLSIRGIGGGTIYSYIPVTENRAQASFFTVPKNKMLYISGISFSSVGNKIMRFTSEATYDSAMNVTTTAGKLFYPYTTISVYNAPYYQELDPPTRFPQYTDLRIQVIADSAGSEATCQYKGWLIND